MHATRLDGNALAGMLAGILGDEPTTLRLACGGCGAESSLAETVVELDDVCGIARCRRCTRTLFTVLSTTDGVRLSFAGLGSITG